MRVARADVLYPQLEEDWLLIADRNFDNWKELCTAADIGAALLWRVKADPRLPPLEFFPDGSYWSVLVNGSGPQETRYVRVIEYEVPDREGDGKGEIIALITTIVDFPDVPEPVLVRAHTDR